MDTYCKFIQPAWSRPYRAFIGMLAAGFLLGFGINQAHAQSEFESCAKNNDDLPSYSVEDSYNPDYIATLELKTAVIGPGDDFCIGNDPGKDTVGGCGSFLFTGLEKETGDCPVVVCFSPRQGCGTALGNVCIWVEDPNNPGAWLNVGAPIDNEGVCVEVPEGVTEFSITICRPGQGPVSINDVTVSRSQFSADCIPVEIKEIDCADPALPPASTNPEAVFMNIVPSACGTLVMTHTDEVISGTLCPIEVVRTYTLFDDLNGNQTLDNDEKFELCDHIFNIVDNTPPRVTSCPADATVECLATPSFGTPKFVDDCDQDLTVTSNDVTTPGNCGADGYIEQVTRTWTATDDCGNSVQCSQTITVDDTVAPRVTSCPADATVECPATPSFGAPVFVDDCDQNLTVTSNDVTTPGNCRVDGYIERVTRTWTATDDCGNSVQCSQTITVDDTVAPRVTSCPADATIECPATPSFGTPVFVDDCDQNLTVTSNDVTTPGDCGADGYFERVTRTWTATDDCGNSVQCSQTITVDDTVAPRVTSCPADATIECPATPSFGTPVFVDDCDQNLTVTSNDVTTPGNCRVDGYIERVTRTWTATDDCGNSVQCSQTITVVDTKAPTVTCPENVAFVTCGDNCPTDPNTTGWATATDDCDGVINNITYSDVTSGDCPKIITRTWKATDSCGNTATCVQTISCLIDVVVTDSSLCTFDRYPDACDSSTERQFRLLFTPDSLTKTCYKLTASNPGQTFFNVFTTGTPGETVEFTLTIPYPYVTQGAQPVHAYNGLDVESTDTGICLVPHEGIPVEIIGGGVPITLDSYSGANYSLTARVVVPDTSVVYVNIHLDYGLKRSGGYKKGENDNALGCDGGGEEIPNCKTYLFEVSGAVTGSDEVSSVNEFKKNPGVGGAATRQVRSAEDVLESMPVEDAEILLLDADGNLLQQAVTDEDGWYMLPYKHRGRESDFQVIMVSPQPILNVIPMKANRFKVVNFEVDGDK